MKEDIYTRNALAANQDLKKLWLPPPDITVSEHAQKHRWLSPEANIGRVKWYNESMPHLVEPMDCLSASSPYTTVICMFPSQDGKTEIALNWIEYIIDIAPGPFLQIQPNERPMGEAFAKERLQPMLRDCPILEGKVGDVNSRTGNTVLHKMFPGGHLTVIGSNSPAGLAARAIRYRHLEEINRHAINAGKEGSPEALSAKRLRRFQLMGIDKTLITSSPTYEGVGIDIYYQAADIQKEWQIKCLSCGRYQYPRREEHIIWTKDKADTVRFKCEHCGYEHKGPEELKTKNTAKWVEIENKPNGKKIAFHKSMYTNPAIRWADQIQSWLDMQGDIEQMQVYINTEEAENYELKGETVDEHELMLRREQYTHQVPDGVLVLTQSVDVQANRWEIEVKGWGDGFENWGISYYTVYGDPSNVTEWEALWDYLTLEYQSPSGLMRPIWTFVDMGFLADPVKEFCFKHKTAKVRACKGTGDSRKSFLNPFNKIKLKDGVREIELYTIGANEGKQLVHRWLSVSRPGPGYCHFPMSYGKEYFDGLASEHLVTRKRGGQIYKVFELRPGRHGGNEALDLFNYNAAAIKYLNPVWDKVAKNLKKEDHTKMEHQEDRPKLKRRPIRSRRGSNFVKNW